VVSTSKSKLYTVLIGDGDTATAELADATGKPGIPAGRVGSSRVAIFGPGRVRVQVQGSKNVLSADP